MLEVPAETVYTNLKAIALAAETDLLAGADPHTMDALLDLALQFRSKLYMVRVSDNCVNRALRISHKPAHLTSIFKNLNTEFRCIEGEDVADTLTRFVRSYAIRNLAMVLHRYSALERWFVVSETKEMAFASSIPLLIIPEKLVGDAVV